MSKIIDRNANSKMNALAIIIQAAWRGYLTRKQLKTTKVGYTTLQRNVR